MFAIETVHNTYTLTYYTALYLFFQSLLSPPATNIQPLPEYKTEAAKKPRWVIAHYGMFKTCWDVFVLLSTIYVAVVVPYNACFPETFELPEGCFNETGSNASQALFPWGFRLDSEIPPPTLNLSSSGYIANQIKSSIFVDVIVEIVFIIGTQCTYIIH